jgi:peptidoglycan hydrolase-like protein with peptidoglycan-binding domain
MRNLMLITASVIALGMGAAGVTPAAKMNDISGPNPPVAGMPRSSQTWADLVNDDIRQAQQELTAQGLYDGPIDGALNEKTKAAVSQYQGQNGLSITGSLDPATMRSLHEDAGIAGSSTPPNNGTGRPTGLMTNPHPELLGGSRPGGNTAPY